VVSFTTQQLYAQYPHDKWLGGLDIPGLKSNLQNEMGFKAAHTGLQKT
jgi:hypothetical protein